MMSVLVKWAREGEYVCVDRERLVPSDILILFGLRILFYLLTVSVYRLYRTHTIRFLCMNMCVGLLQWIQIRDVIQSMYDT